MPDPRMTRREMTEAGNVMAVEAVKGIDQTLPEGATPAFADKAVDMFLKAMEQQAEIYRRDGIPEKWVSEFRRAFVRTMTTEFEALMRANGG